MGGSRDVQLRQLVGEQTREEVVSGVPNSRVGVAQWQSCGSECFLQKRRRDLPETRSLRSPCGFQTREGSSRDVVVQGALSCLDQPAGARVRVLGVTRAEVGGGLPRFEHPRIVEVRVLGLRDQFEFVCDRVERSMLGDLRIEVLVDDPQAFCGDSAGTPLTHRLEPIGPLNLFHRAEQARFGRAGRFQRHADLALSDHLPQVGRNDHPEP